MTTYACEICDFTCCKPIDWQRHLKTNKHIGRSTTTKKSFECKICSFICSKQSAYNVHINTKKHASRLRDDVTPLPECGTTTINEQSSQIARKIGLAEFIHPDYMDIIKQLLCQNNELKNFIIEQTQDYKKETTDILNRVIEQANEHKKDTVDIIAKVVEQTKSHTITNSTITTNSNNKAFNINVFLNETCKDAINLSDFIKNITVSREDLENNAQLGFVGGVSKILIDNLKQLDKSQRPIHCTDLKRETMYIKEDDKWSKEEDSSKLNQIIQEITRKSMRTLLAWKAENPDDKDRDSAFSERCIVIQQQSMAGYDREIYYPKVIKAIAKEVIVDK